jgi:hypothetical protein
MNQQTKSNWQKQLLFTTIAILFFIFAANSQAIAQKYKVGERVEVDPSGIKNWLKGTVLPFTEKDEPTFQGEYYLARVLIDKWKATYPEGVLVQTKDIRPLKGEAVKNPPNQNQNAETPPNKNEPTEKETTENEFGAKFKPGDRVECDTMNIGKWFKGTVLPFKENDNPDAEKDKTGKYFYIHRVLLDSDATTRPAGGFCFTDRTRLLAGGAPMEIPKTAVPIGKVTVDENNTLSADRPILDCPVEQPKVRNGVRPNAEMIKKITRCDKGEKPASKGMDGAVTVDVTAVDFGAPRQWIYSRDIGGKPGTTIYPVRITYTVKTFYRYRTQVEENWVRTINFYVNEFGEWQSGSEEPIKSPTTKDIPRLP